MTQKAEDKLPNIWRDDLPNLSDLLSLIKSMLHLYTLDVKQASLNFCYFQKRRRNEKGEKREKKYWKNGKNLEGAKGSD